ncbi:hypothetical protein THAOC_09524 [Thalassiosira oceanica]|uniref:Uncharacterized protein n=1 Tax=Thalassiosira oceanica TaxID=159749 RepID=K0SWA4_THAOC|nr:hypothetical protein THAOC_09524 [Thalassiosira oceanica]|eukprot:EJK69234.1 hypothetical protein THAOC_09524 [Thalassiosira oceanica]
MKDEGRRPDRLAYQVVRSKAPAWGSQNGPRKGPRSPVKRVFIENLTAASVRECPSSTKRDQRPAARGPLADLDRVVGRTLEGVVRITDAARPEGSRKKETHDNTARRWREQDTSAQYVGASKPHAGGVLRRRRAPKTDAAPAGAVAAVAKKKDTRRTAGSGGRSARAMDYPPAAAGARHPAERGAFCLRRTAPWPAPSLGAGTSSSSYLQRPSPPEAGGR